VALGGGPEEGAEGAVDLEAGEACDDAGFGVVGEEPVGGESAGEQARIGRISWRIDIRRPHRPY